KFNIPKSTKKEISKSNFEIRFDTEIVEVIKGCADRQQTWISERLIEAYKRLIKRGHIHSVETWKDGKLVGGLYGVTFRGAFFGESMIWKESQASKEALISLLIHLKDNDFVLLDVQYMTDHLKIFGAKEIIFDEYKSILVEAYQRFGTF